MDRVMAALRTLALVTLVALVGTFIGNRRQDAATPEPTPEVTPATSDEPAATIQFGAGKPKVVFPIIHDARELAAFAAALAEGFRQQGYVEVRIEMPSNVRTEASSAGKAGHTPTVSQPEPAQPADDEAATSESDESSDGGCQDGHCTNNSYRRGRR